MGYPSNDASRTKKRSCERKSETIGTAKEGDIIANARRWPFVTNSTGPPNTAVWGGKSPRFENGLRLGTERNLCGEWNHDLPGLQSCARGKREKLWFVELIRLKWWGYDYGLCVRARGNCYRCNALICYGMGSEAEVVAGANRCWETLWRSIIGLDGIIESSAVISGSSGLKCNWWKLNVFYGLGLHTQNSESR